MEKYADYSRVLNSSKVLALATSVDNVPNVRLLSYVHDLSRPGVVYFATENHSRKVEEFWENSKVAVTTIPTDDVSHIRSVDSSVSKSKFTIKDMSGKFAEVHDGYDKIIEAMGDVLEVYEISIKDCVVVTGMDQFETVSFQ
ncbi:pyridoxamine 5'-phosphate oxidase family protein [Seleniivibrio sp.]|uniref:pyridoxamine 5'-phosphate oxidase family protein n=1 Tax=Seleniivibrio sp. TaxID=2898801 RepID=UPI0025DD25A8|nr:pyridoxamine 5'-phosphate oxidase family protein [Seleniivibrio sp.]MCD8552317.1 pyridoxamine 5'-phosphate oxidase family protein [Seleniivibrio sp.]